MQCVKPLLPQRSVPIEPAVDLRERFRTQAVDTKLCALPDLDQADLSQHPEMAGNTRTGDGQHRRQLAHRRGTVAKGFQYRAATLIPQGFEDCIHRVNVPYWLRNRSGTYEAAVTLAAEPTMGG